jgi:hypothetical protein
MSSRNRSRRPNGRHALPPLHFEGQPTEPPEAQRTETEPAEPGSDDEPNGAEPRAGSRRERRRRRSPAARENIDSGPVRADARPAVVHQPFRHRSR